jgi:hypothetical protein
LHEPVLERENILICSSEFLHVCKECCAPTAAQESSLCPVQSDWAGADWAAIFEQQTMSGTGEDRSQAPAPDEERSISQAQRAILKPEPDPISSAHAY